MGLRDKVALVLLAVVVTQLTIAYCMPSLSRKASLQRYLNNFKQIRSNPVTKSPLPTRGTKPTKSVFTKCKQGRSSSSAPPEVSMYKDFNFPEIEYAYDFASKDPFNIAANVNSNIFEKINKEATNQQSEVIQNLKKEMRIKRKLNKLNDENVHSKRDVPLASCPSSLKSIWLQDQETFPEVQYPLSAVETWTPNYWNPSLFTQNDNQNYNSKWPTFDPNASEKSTIFYKPYKQQLKSKTNQFLDEIKKFKEKMRTTTSNTTPNTATGTSGDSNLSSNPLADAVPYVNKETQVITSDAKKEIYLINTGTPKESKSAEKPAEIRADNVHTCADKVLLQSTEIAPGVALIEISSKGEVVQLPTQSDTTKVMEPATLQIESNTIPEIPVPIPYKVFEQSNACPAYQLNNTKNYEINTYEENLDPGIPIILGCTDKVNISPPASMDQCITDTEINLPEVWNIPAVNINTCAHKNQLQTMGTLPKSPSSDIPAKDEALPPSDPLSNAAIGMDYVDTTSLPVQKVAEATSIPFGTSNGKLSFSSTPTADYIKLEAGSNDEIKQSSVAKAPYTSVIVVPVGDSLRKIQLPITEPGTGTPIIVFIQANNQSTVTATDIPRMTQSVSEEALNVSMYSLSGMSPLYEPLQTDTTFNEHSNLQLMPIEYMFEVPPTDILYSKSVLPDLEILPENSMCHVSTGSVSPSTNKTYESYILTDAPFNKDPMSINTALDNSPSDFSDLDKPMSIISIPDSSPFDIPNLDKPMPISPIPDSSLSDISTLDKPIPKIPIPDSSPSDLSTLDKPMPIIPIPDSSPSDIPNFDKSMPIIPIPNNSPSNIPKLDKPMSIIPFTDTSPSDITNLANSLLDCPELLSSDPTKEFHQPNNGLPVFQPQDLVIPNIILPPASEVISNTPNILKVASSPPVDKNPINAIHSDVGANNPTNEVIEDSTNSSAINDASQLPAKIPPDNTMPEMPVVVYIKDSVTLPEDHIDIRDGSVSDTDKDGFFMPVGKVLPSNVLNDVNKDDTVGVEEDNKDIRGGSISDSDKDSFVTPVDKVLPNTVFTDVNEDGIVLLMDKKQETTAEGVMKDPKILIDEIVPENRISDINRNEKISPNNQLLTKDIPLPESIDSLDTSLSDVPKVTFPFPIDKTLANRRITDMTEDLPVFEPLDSLLQNIPITDINKDSFPLTVEQQSDRIVPGVKESEPGLIEDKKLSNVRNIDQTDEELSMLQDTSLIGSDVSKVTTNVLKLPSMGLLLANDDEIADIAKGIQMEPKAMELRDTTSAKSPIGPLSTTIELLPESPNIDITKIIPVAVEKAIPDNIIYNISEGDIQKIVDALRDTLLSRITNIDKLPVDQPVASHTPTEILEEKTPSQLTELLPTTRDIIEGRKSIKDTSSSDFIENERSLPVAVENSETPTKLETSTTKMTVGYGLEKEVRDTELTDVIKNERSLPIPIELSVALMKSEALTTDNTNGHGLNKEVLDTAVTSIIKNKGSLPIASELPETPLTEKRTNFRPEKAPSNSPLTRISINNKILPAVIELLERMTTGNTKGYSLDEEAPNTELNDVIKNQGSLPIAIELSETATKLKSSTTEDTKGYGLDKVTPNTVNIDVTENEEILPITIELSETRTKLEPWTNENTKGNSLDEEAPDPVLTEIIDNEGNLPIAFELSEIPTEIKISTTKPTNSHGSDKVTPDAVLIDVVKNQGSFPIAIELAETPTKLETSKTEMTKAYGLDKNTRHTALTDVIKDERSSPIAIELLENPTTAETSTTDNTMGHGSNKEALDTAVTEFFKNEGILPFALELLETPLTEDGMYLRPGKAPSNSSLTRINMNDKILQAVIELLQKLTTGNTKGFRLDAEYRTPNTEINDVIKNQGSLPIAIEFTETPTKLKALTTENIKGHGLDKVTSNTIITNITENEGRLPNAETAKKLETTTNKNTKGHGLDKETLNTVLTDVTKTEGSPPIAMELLETPTKLETSTTENITGYGLDKEAIYTAFNDVIKSKESLTLAVEPLETALPDKTAYLTPDTGPSNSLFTSRSMNHRILPIDIELLETLVSENTKGDSLDEEAPDKTLSDAIKNQGSFPIAIELPEILTKLETSTTEITKGYGLDKKIRDTALTDVIKNERSSPIAIEFLENPTTPETLTTDNTKGHGLNKQAQDTAFSNFFNNEGSLPIDLELLGTPLTEKRMYFNPHKAPSDSPITRININDKILPAIVELLKKITILNTKGYSFDEEAPNTVLTDVIKNQGSLPIAIELLEAPTKLETSTNENTKGFDLQKEAVDTAFIGIIRNQENLPSYIELLETTTKEETSKNEKEEIHTTFTDDIKKEGSLPITIELSGNPNKEPSYSLLTRSNTSNRILHVDIELLETLATKNTKSNSLDKKASDTALTDVINNEDSLPVTMELPETTLLDETKDFRQDNPPSKSPLTSINNNGITSPVDVELLETSTTENTEAQGLDKEAPATALTNVNKNERGLSIAMELPENRLPDATMHLRSDNWPSDSPITPVHWNDRILYPSHPLDTPLLETSTIENTHGLDKEGQGIVPSDLLKNEGSLPIGMELSLTSQTDKTMELRTQEGPADSTPTHSNENDGTLPVDVKLLLETLMAENNRLEEKAPDIVTTDIIRNEGSLSLNIESPETLLNNNAYDVELEKEIPDSSLSKISKDIMPLSIDHDLSVPLSDEEQLLIDKTIDVILSPDKKYIRDALASLIEKLPVSLGRDLANTELTNLVKYIYLST